MDDIIYRQAAIDALMPIYKSASLRNRNVFSTAKKCMATIEELPSSQQWIPCNERLPRLDEEVLATTAWNDITMACRIGIDKWFIHEGNTNATTDDLIAWCPLPEPYKGEGNG